MECRLPNLILYDLLKVEPSLSGKKGEMLKGRTNPLKDTFWEINTGPINSVDSSIQVNRIHNLLLPAKDILIHLVEKHKLSPLLNIIIRINQEPLPAIYIDAEQMRFF